MTVETVPEAEIVEPEVVDELPEHTGQATLIVEEGIVILNRAAVRACEGMRREAQLRLHKKDKEDWLFSQVYLASIAAKRVLEQAEGVLLAAEREDIAKHLGKHCKQALKFWAAGVRASNQLIDNRLDAHDLSADRDPAQIKNLRQYLVTMVTKVIPKSTKAMQRNSKARYKRLGKKRGAIAREQALAIEARAARVFRGDADNANQEDAANEAQDNLGMESGEGSSGQGGRAEVYGEAEGRVPGLREGAQADSEGAPEDGGADPETQT